MDMEPSKPPKFPTEPIAPPSAYDLYCMDNFDVLKAANPSKTDDEIKCLLQHDFLNLAPRIRTAYRESEQEKLAEFHEKKKIYDAEFEIATTNLKKRHRTLSGNSGNLSGSDTGEEEKSVSGDEDKLGDENKKKLSVEVKSQLVVTKDPEKVLFSDETRMIEQVATQKDISSSDVQKRQIPRKSLVKRASSQFKDGTPCGHVQKLFSNFFRGLYGKKLKLLMAGLDAAGKTTILYKLKFKDVDPVPTLDFNLECVQYKNVSFTVCDVGGPDKYTWLWYHQLDNVQGLIFVVDSDDVDRLGEARQELTRLLTDKKLQNAVLLILANKQDLPNALNTDEISGSLDLHSLRNHDWNIQPTCAVTGNGIYEGLDWLFNKLKNIK